jgi:hypothetical protein
MVKAAMNKVIGLRDHIARCERGESETFEFTALIVPLVVMISMIAFATLVRSKQMPAWSAASECVREAVSTRDEDTGREQGTQAALDMLAGNYVDPSTAQVKIEGTWEPGTAVTCQVTYVVDVSGIPLVGDLAGGGVTMSGQVTLRTEPYKSRWQ